MVSSLISVFGSLVIWMIDKFIKNSQKKEEAKKRFLAYVDYWQKNRENPTDVSDDIDILIEKSDEKN